MKRFQGIGISPGIAIGPAFKHSTTPLTIESGKSDDPEGETLRLQNAIQAARQQLEQLHSDAADFKERDILQAYLLFLEDPDLLERAFSAIRNENLTAEFSWFRASGHFIDLIAKLDDPYIKTRSVDLQHVSQQVLAILAGKTEQERIRLDKPGIIVAGDLSSANLFSLDRSKTLGLFISKGSASSHVAIIAKALGIPAVAGSEAVFETVQQNDPLIVDGNKGEVILDPDAGTRKRYQSQITIIKKEQEADVQAAGKPAVTTDGHRVHVLANINAPADAQEAQAFGAEGVGLLRTEYLFLERADEPGEDEQAASYVDIFRHFEKLPLTIRLLDAGGDKTLPFMAATPGPNPFSGLRGIRHLLQHPQILQTQLRALLRAGAGYSIRIMAPMVSSMEEVRLVQNHIQTARESLTREKKPFAKDAPIGMMVETPAAAIMADKFAGAVDFFSLGTNDLAQYTLAADRNNPDVARWADPFDPSLLRLIQMTVKAAKAKGITVSACGEWASESLALPILVGLGIEQLSVTPGAIPHVKQNIRRLDFSKAHHLSQRLVKLETAGEVRESLRTHYPEL